MFWIQLKPVAYADVCIPTFNNKIALDSKLDFRAVSKSDEEHSI